MRLDYSTYEEKLVDIQTIVNNMFSRCSDPGLYNDLMLIDSICDVPFTEGF